jgi:MOSC domain-containing protein YiiM
MKIIKQFWNTTFCGVYFKVIQAGFVTTGDVFEKIKGCPENPTIATLYEARRVDNGA